MAGMRYAISTTFAPSLDSDCGRRKFVVHQSSIDLPSVPPRRNKRKNHLRPKILKTLTKPYPDLLSPQLPQYPNTPIEPIEPIEPYVQLDPRISPDSLQVHNINPDFAEEFTSPSTIGELQIGEGNYFVKAPNCGLVGFSAPDVIKIGIYLVGLYVAQTVCSVLFFGFSDTADKDRDSRIRKGGDLGINGSDIAVKYKTKDGDTVHVDEAAMEVKIAEIRNMAREAREAERKMLIETGEQADGVEGNEKDVVGKDESSRVRSGIAKDLDGRLTNLRRSFNAVQEKLPSLNVNMLSTAVEGLEAQQKKKNDRELEDEETDEKLMFKRKNKYRSERKIITDKPKGFKGRESTYGSKRKHGGAGGAVLDKGQDLGDPCSKSDRQSYGASDNKNGNMPKTERENENRYAGSQVSGCGGINQDSIEQSQKNVAPLKNGGSSTSEVGDNSSDKKTRKKSSVGHSDFWWSNLPYVHAILLQKGSQSERLQGFFKLRSPSAENEKSPSHTVTFEDLADAQNFCYILESFFKDLSDASIGVAPLSVKKMKEAVKSSTMRVIVVKKGQLQHCAGKPFNEVQMALRRLME